MYVRRVELTDFRSYERVAVDLDPGVTVLVGQNGMGKTNLVEALGYVATLDSHRVATDAPLVRAGAAAAVIRCAIVHDGRELLVELEIVPGKANRARLNRSPVRRAREVLGALRMVLFAPEDLELVRGDPAERRRYLDDLLVARQPRYAGVRADYDRVVKQRNALLRTAYLTRKVGGTRGQDLSTLTVWDQHLAHHGAELLAGRLELVSALAPHVTKAYDAVAAGRSAANIAYASRLGERLPRNQPTDTSSLGERLPRDRPEDLAPDRSGETSPPGEALPDRPEDTSRPGEVLPPDRPALEAAILAALAERRTAEIERGVTLVGPHRDDLLLSLGDLPAKGYASHGESWSFALALRLAAYDLLRSDGIEPVLVLDDVFAELDAGRRNRLAALVSAAAQLIVTCAVPEDVPSTLQGARYDVGLGTVTRVG